MDTILGSSGSTPEELRMKIAGLVPAGDELYRNSIFEGVYASLPRDPEARIWIYSFEVLPGGYTNPHLHNGATFFVLMQGEFEAHFDDGSILRAKTGDVYSEPIGKIHRGHNPRSDISALGVSFSATSPDREHITNVLTMDNDPMLRG